MARKVMANKKIVKSEIQDAEHSTVKERSKRDSPRSPEDTATMESDNNTMNVTVTNGIERDHEDPCTSSESTARAHANDSGYDSEGGINVLGRGVKPLIQAIQVLRDLGVEDLEVPLPKIVVVGDQSTGKSSLIEGISEIKVPRASGTCTRCPLEINLVENSAEGAIWTCHVTLVRRYVYDKSLIERATKARPLGPWVSISTEKVSFATINSKHEIQAVLERAQLATLNIGNAPEDYMVGKPLPRDQHMVKFSPNIIQLDISGSGLPNLSFYDLPGVINVSEIQEEEYLVALVKNLVKEYITSEDCINLLALPMTDDPANSSASRLIREVKGAADRTIGVITKPDRFQSGESYDQWKQILSGVRFRLGYGYFVVKNNPDTEVEHAIARVEEANFFGEQQPWCTDLRAFSKRFGTVLLQTTLSQKLTAQIRKSLPHIREQVELKAEAIEEKLSKLPEPLEGDLPAKLYGDIIKFGYELQKYLDGGNEDCPFQREWHDLSLKFRETMEGLYPVVVVAPPASSQRQGSSLGDTPGKSASYRHPEPISIESGDDSDTQQTAASPNYKTKKRPHSSAQSTPRKTARTMSTIPLYKADKPTAKRFTLDEIRRIRLAGYIGLPGSTDPKTEEKMIKLSTVNWGQPTDEFVQESGKLCSGIVFERVLSVFGHRQNTQFFDELNDICRTFLQEAVEDQVQLVKRILGWEFAKPMTLNEKGMEEARQQATEYLQRKRREGLARAWVEDQETKTGKFTTGTARDDKVAKVTDAQVGPDPYSLEMKIIASVRGYYECAFSRFVDNVCISMNQELFLKCRNELETYIKKHFRATEEGAEERLAILLAANPEDERRRAQLKRELETMTRAAQHLEGLTGHEE